jgi:hypothetical protein
MLTAERIRGRQVSIEIGEVPGVGWVAIGIVTKGLSHEKGCGSKHAPQIRRKPSNG